MFEKRGVLANVRFRVMLVMAIATVSVAAAPDSPSPHLATASAAPTPLIWLDATNPASYPGTGTAVTDLSGNNRNGTIRGNGITFNSTTKALEFPGGTNGTAYIELSANMSSFTGGITIEFEGEFGSTRAHWERIFDFAAGVNSTANAFWVGQFEQTNELGVEVFLQGDTSNTLYPGSSGYCHTATGGTALGASSDRSFNKWVVTIGNDANKLCRIYKNGVEVATRLAQSFNTRNISATGANLNGTPFKLPLVTNRNSSFVGRSNFSQDRDLEGSIRYLRIYDQTLTPAQIATNATRTVTFDANNGQGAMTPQSASTSSALTSNSFSRPGYTFAGWNTRAGGNGTSFANGAPYDFIADTTLFAQWTPNSLNVTYDSQGGSAVASGTTTTGASIASSPTAPTRAGYTFNGWFAAATGGSAIAFPYAHGQTSDFILYAQWTAVGTAKTESAPTTTSTTTVITSAPPVPNQGAGDVQPLSADNLPSTGLLFGQVFVFAFACIVMGSAALRLRRRQL